jgi:thioredoxin 1
MRTVKLLILFLVLAAGTARPADTVLYPDPSQAKGDIAAALKTAAATHKRVLLDFGGNWCPDCKVLDIYFHDQANSPLVQANFVVVHVNVGHFDANQDIAERYQVPLKRGVPAMAVLSDHGQLLFSQQTGQFEDMRHMESSSLTEFLTKWKPAR